MYAGYDKDRNPLQLESNNPGVIDIWDKSPPSWPGDRLIHISGLKVDFTVLDAREKRGLKYCSIQVQVRPMAPQAGKLEFASMDKCGIAALDEILNRSITEGAEYSGLIFTFGVFFGFTAPVRGEPDSALPALNVPDGTTTVGTYHTHGNKKDSGEIFSPQDRGFHNLRHWFAYLGTPSRAILKFTPKDRPPDEHPALAAFGGKAEKLR